MAFIDTLTSSLTAVDNMLAGGKINVEVKNPTVEISAQEAIKYAAPYLILLAAVAAFGILIFAGKGK